MAALCMAYDYTHVNQPYNGGMYPRPAYGNTNNTPYHNPPAPYHHASRRPMRPRHDNEPPRSQQVCLDHLKGICTLKRARCKYAHPPLPQGGTETATSSNTFETIPAPSQAPPGVRVCEVYALTGFCKFGSQCRDYHPPTGLYGPVCAPACTWKMGRESRNAAGAVAMAQVTEIGGVSDQPEVCVVSATQTAQRLRSLCVDSTEDAFDAAFTEAAELLSCHEDTGAVLQQLAPLLYASAIGKVDGAPHTAKWCRYLFTLAPHDSRSALRAQLTSSCGNLLYHVETFAAAIALEEERVALDRKRLANAMFLGHLLSEGLVHQRFFEQAVDYLLLCSSKQGAEAAFSARLLCAMLRTAGQHLPQQYGMQMAQRLRDLSSRYPVEVQAEIEAALRLFAEEEPTQQSQRSSTPPAGRSYSR